MKKMLLLWGLLTLLASTAASAAGFDDRYTVRTGDLNGDGRTDIYLKHNPRLAMIPLDDLTVPVPLPADVSEFVLQQNAAGDFDLVSTLGQAAKDAIKQWAVQTAIEIVLKDFNIDGILDVLVRGVGSVIPNAHNVFVFGPQNARTPPLVAKSVSGAIDQFIQDVGGFSDNPNYFVSGVSVVCGIVYIRTLNYDPYSNEYYYSWDPYLVCEYVFDPSGFSIPAINFLNRFVPMANDGEVIAQSTDAVTVSQILEDLFGIEFFKGGFEQAGIPEPSECAMLTAPDSGACVKHERMAKLGDLLRTWAAKALDALGCANGVPHSYSLSPGAGAIAICPLGHPLSPTCSEQNVYHEQLTHPVLGYLSNHLPIHEGQTGTAEFGLPGPFDNGGPIIFHVNKPIQWHQNQTMDGHIFHSGYVNRQTVVFENQVYITTVGGGTGACPTLNEVVGLAVFKTVDAFILFHIRNGVTSQHLPIP